MVYQKWEPEILSCCGRTAPTIWTRILWANVEQVSGLPLDIRLTEWLMKVRSISTKFFLIAFSSAERKLQQDLARAGAIKASARGVLLTLQNISAVSSRAAKTAQINSSLAGS